MLSGRALSRALGERPTHPVKRFIQAPFQIGGASRRRPDREPLARIPTARQRPKAAWQRP
jgi:hypothetical protein